MTSSYNLDNQGDGRPPYLDWVDSFELVRRPNPVVHRDHR